ncbi:MAG TPA: phosphohistidine phosphatase SixA [Allocoleopsis sp.]
MELYLIRHGLAAERGTYATDEERPLTEEGMRKTRRVAKRLSALNLKFDLIQTSPLVRAKQTAEILRETGLCSGVEESVYLAPAGDFNAWLDWLWHWQTADKRTSLAIVGHEPDLGEWTEQLVWGEVQQHLIVKKAGVLGIEIPAERSPIGQCYLFWLTPPRLLLED